ncbi:PH domain-containing protein [Tsuneonella rigui]|uniref:PH domain-containing protein n=1 Tax=Tsuneonella rigui TaxID=1708790 RepID=UPI000F7E10E1|nr:PH domain-containing protein [Tsuneonella rigui]
MTGAALAPRRTAPLGVLVGAVSSIRQSVFPAAAGAYGLREAFGNLAFVAAFALLLLVIGGVGSFLKWWRTTYVVGAEDIRLESGVLSRAARSVPYERIQDVSLEQPLLARLLGLAAVKFETGAGGKDELTLAYLPLAEGARLRELVRDRKDDAVPAVAAAAAEPAGQVLFAMSPKRLALFGLFEFSLAAVAVALGAAQQLDFLLPFDVWDWDHWREVLDVPTHRIAELGPLVQAFAALVILLAVSVIGVTTGVVRTIMRDWGFVLERTAKGFRRRRGLFNKSDVVMPAHRVQALQLRTRWLRRRFGWQGLKFVSLAQDQGSGSHAVAPFAQLDEIDPIVRAAGFALPDAATDWHRPARRAFIDRAVLSAAIPLAPAVGLAFSPEPLLAVVPLLAIPLLALRQVFLWHRARHAIDERHVYASHGWLAPRIDVASRVKLQSVEIAQGPLARRGGYATLHLGLAGGTLAFHAVPLAEARRMRDAVLDSIARLDFSQLS